MRIIISYNYKKMPYVYMLHHQSDAKKFYIGHTRRRYLCQRLAQHIVDAKDLERDSVLYNYMRLHNYEGFVMKNLFYYKDKISELEERKLEQKYFDKYIEGTNLLYPPLNNKRAHNEDVHNVQIIRRYYQNHKQEILEKNKEPENRAKASENTKNFRANRTEEKIKEDLLRANSKQKELRLRKNLEKFTIKYEQTKDSKDKIKMENYKEKYEEIKKINSK